MKVTFSHSEKNHKDEFECYYVDFVIDYEINPGRGVRAGGFGSVPREVAEAIAGPVPIDRDPRIPKSERKFYEAAAVLGIEWPCMLIDLRRRLITAVGKDALCESDMDTVRKIADAMNAYEILEPYAGSFAP